MADQIRAWAQVQWGEVELGDAQRTRRAVDIAAAMAANADLSLPRQMIRFPADCAGWASRGPETPLS